MIHAVNVISFSFRSFVRSLLLEIDECVCVWQSFAVIRFKRFPNFERWICPVAPKHLHQSWSFKLNGIFWTRFCGDFETNDKKKLNIF